MTSAEHAGSVHRLAMDFQPQLDELLVQLLRDVRADKGFIAFEDVVGNLSIVVNRGDFWHLKKSAGATGRVMDKGEAAIINNTSTNPDFKPTDGDVGSELIYPIRHQDRVVGAILLDRTQTSGQFTPEAHYPPVEACVQQVISILDRDEPWMFRKWWDSQRSAKSEALFVPVYELVRASLEVHASDEGSNGAAIEARVYRFTSDGRMQLFGSPLGELLDEERSDEDVVREAQRTGEQSRRTRASSRHELAIPFPPEGPVLGLIQLAAGDASELPPSMVAEIDERLAAVAYQHYRPAVPRGPQQAEHYFDLVLAGVTSPGSPDGAHGVLERIARGATGLCGSKLKIYYVPAAAGDFPDSIYVQSVDAEQLNDLLGRPTSSPRRPYCERRGAATLCPVICDGWEARAMLEIEDPEADGALAMRYISELMLSLSPLVALVLDRVRS